MSEFIVVSIISAACGTYVIIMDVFIILEQMVRIFIY